MTKKPRARAKVKDSLENLTIGLGDPTKDKLLGTYFAFQEMTREQLNLAYRGDWIARKCVDIPAQDATREWRNWQAESTDITAIEKLEKTLSLQSKLRSALSRARLYGGAALVLGVNQGRAEEELRVDKVQRGQLQFVHVVSPHELTPGPLIKDLTSPYFGEPEWWTRNSIENGMVQIHPSRVVTITGVDRPDRLEADSPWGDSVLQSVADAVRAAGLTTNTIAQMVAESKIDVIGVPGLTENLMSAGYEERLRDRFAMANTIKSVYSILLRDAAEDWERLTVNFAGLPEVLKIYLLIACGAVDIPATRFLGQSPTGMNSSGESETRNYYDGVASDQKTEVGPALNRLDQVLVRSALGTWPEGTFYEWNSLWQMTEEQKAELAKKKADVFKIDVDSGLFTPTELRRARENQLIEDGTYPGLEQILEDEPDFGDIENTDARRVKDAAPRTLYVRRNVLNAAEIIKWAKSVGFATTLPAGDMHVTIAFSRKPVDWMRVPDNQWAAREDGTLRINPGGPRIIEIFGEAKVLSFVSSELSYRHESIKIETGATWDHPQYQPHITLSYGPTPDDLSLLEGYQGEIILGPEIFEEVDEDWREGVTEDAKPDRSDYFQWGDDDLKPVKRKTDDFNPHHEPAGSSIGGQFASASAGSGTPHQRETLINVASEQKLPTVLEMDQWQQKCLGEHELTGKENDVFNDYSNNAYGGINDYLRGKGPSYQSDLRRIEVMDGLFDKTALDKETVVYRGMSGKRYNAMKKTKDGAVLTDGGFVSTSVSRKVAEGFSKKSNKVVPIILRKGSKALPMGSLSYTNRAELEVLIARGQRFEKQSLPDGSPVLVVG